MRNTHCLLILLLVAGSLGFSQQLLVLNSGVQLHGRYAGGNADTIAFIDEHGRRHKLDIHEVQSLIFNPAASPTGAPYEPPRGAVPVAFAERGYVDNDEVPTAGWSRYAVIPAGTEIIVRTIDPIDVRRPDPHQQFLASVEHDVLDAEGRVVIPRGSPAHLIVHDVGDGEIAVDLRSVNVHGKRLILNSENIIGGRTRDNLGANRRTGKFLGGGALLGTVLGAIAGGGKGAAIGAISGAAAGAGTQVLLTRGSAIHIPSETVLTFRLDQPVYLYE